MTAADGRHKSLGRGLSALLGEDAGDYAELDRLRSSRDVPIESLRRSDLQPRRLINAEDLAELAQSIAENGILQPILVRRYPDEPETFEIIAGERRWRAAQMAKLHTVPVIIRDLGDREVLEVALIENLQRRDLTPLEEATGYQRLIAEFDYTQDDLAQRIGKSRSHVANMLRLLSLPPAIKTLLDEGKLSAGHARALLTASDPDRLARLVVERGLNVRETERLANREASKQGNAPKGAQAETGGKDADTEALEKDLSRLLGMTVEITFKGTAGSLTLHYRTLEQLDDILHKLTQGRHGRDHSPDGDEGDGVDHEEPEAENLASQENDRGGGAFTEKDEP